MSKTNELLKFDVLNVERLRSLFAYDAATGIFTYLTNASRRTPIGSVAGSVNNEGYRHIRVDGRAHKAHRLAWFYMTGKWPIEMIDHIDGNRDNNAFANLREATRSQNLANSKVRRKGRQIRKGLECVGSRWRARIQVNGQPRFLGSFDTQEAAAAAYEAAARASFGEFSKG